MESNTPTARHRSGFRRLGAVVAPALIGVFVLASCGGDDSAATQSTINLNASSTAFVVRPPATTEPPPDTAGGPVVEGTQEYVVQKNDAPLVLVKRFGITLEELLAVNEWATTGEFPFPGETILLPRGAKAVEVAPDTEASGDDAAGTEGDAAEAEPAATIPDAGDNCAPGKHVIAEGDYEGKVAKKYDVTVDALRAANATTKGYSAFYPGLEIVIPAKADC